MPRKGQTVTEATRFASRLKKQYPREYQSWKSMCDRCTNHNAINYERYGGRGVGICPEWSRNNNGFVPFLMYTLNACGPRPSGFSLDRIDSEGDYKPGQVKWSSIQDQIENRRYCHRLTFQGVSMTWAAFSRLIGKPSGTVHGQLKRGRMPEGIAIEAGYKRVA